jgi:hypothetical protein
VEPPPKRPSGYICNEGVRAHVTVNTGMVGVVLFPLIHPEVTDVGAKLASLIRNLPNRGSRPVFVCVRSYHGQASGTPDKGRANSDGQATRRSHGTAVTHIPDGCPEAEVLILALVKTLPWRQKV